MIFLKTLKTKNILLSLLGSMILAFGLYNIHSISAVTEGGVLGLSLFLDHWLALSPAISGLILNALCYLLGWKFLGKTFLAYSAIAAGGFSVFYRILECFPPLYPQIADHPLLAAVLGACFVGVGVGLCVRMGGAPTGDDALAMSLSSAIKCKIQWVYLISDLSVLALSATYIPWQRLGYSLLTVLLSGQIIGWMQFKGKDTKV
ncbi:MAG: YitT family protein [Clostridia bacterium]|nr:YitT family protein [Clostridia bacterium]